MTLRYLEFDYSEDTAGVGTFEAMASVGPAQLAAVHAEVVRVLDWAHDTFGESRGPVGEGGDWDYDLQGQCETSCDEDLTYDIATRQLRTRTGPPGPPRHTVTMALSGTPAFCEAFRQRFKPDT